MDNIEKELKELEEFKNCMLSFHIPRWEELPDIDLYMDQVITFIEQSLYFWSDNTRESIITPSMINNYVKLKLIPKPIKKRYNKVHLAYLFVISILKCVFTIQDIKYGILFQKQLDGEKLAYNSFCEEQENAIKFIANNINSDGQSNYGSVDLTCENFVIKMSTLSFASKLFCQKTINFKKDFAKNDN